LIGLNAFSVLTLSGGCAKAAVHLSHKAAGPDGPNTSTTPMLSHRARQPIAAATVDGSRANVDFYSMHTDYDVSQATYNRTKVCIDIGSSTWRYRQSPWVLSDGASTPLSCAVAVLVGQSRIHPRTAPRSELCQAASAHHPQSASRGPGQRAKSRTNKRNIT
jgi:hypothetical protein